jgi:hypothetical protein
VLFFIETRSAVITQKRFLARFQTRWALSFKTIQKVYNLFNNDGSVLERKRRQPSSVRSPENTEAVREWRCKEDPVNQQGRLQHNWGYPDDWCNEYRSDLNLYPYKITVLP